MVKKFGLSILIPTYNRPEILRDLVKNIVIPVGLVKKIRPNAAPDNAE